VKVPAEKAPPGFPHGTRDEALRLARLCEEWGFDAVTPVEVSVFPDTTLSRGGIPTSIWRNKGMAKRFARAAPARHRRAVLVGGYVVGGVTAPFRPVWNRELFRAVTREVSIPVCAVGGIRTAAEADAILDGREADLVGVGRPFYAQPDVARTFLSGSAAPVLCRNSNLCVPAQMLGMKGLCYNPEVRRAAAAAE
jgi:2,4-dienoyl-CoA reductase-like NADH-dependent reductase (Old Yellow Enzyme family)